MKLTDIIALAKQGYKPADIKELVALAEDPEDQKEEKEDPEDPEDQKEEKEDPEDQKEEKEDPEDQNDYKKLYEESVKKLKEVQKKNREMQKKDDKPKSAEEIALDHINKILI